jgi:hypothetical protein
VKPAKSLGGTLQLDPSPVPVQSETFGGARTWNATIEPPGALAAGLLEAVTPRVFW